MANLQTLKVMRGILRGMIAEPQENIFLDTELNFYLSLAQFDVARRLRKINKDWFAIEREVICDVGSDHSVLTIPTDCLEVIALEATADGQPIKIYDSGKKGILNNSTMYQPSATDMIGFHIGGEILIYPGINLVKLLFIQTPVEISEEADNTIIPVRFIEHVLAYAKWLCAPKTKHINPQSAAQEYENMFMGEMVVKKTEVKAPSPDTPEATK